MHLPEFALTGSGFRSLSGQFGFIEISTVGEIAIDDTHIVMVVFKQLFRHRQIIAIGTLKVIVKEDGHRSIFRTACMVRLADG